MKSLLVRVPAAESFEGLDPIWQEAVMSLQGVWSGQGRNNNGMKILDCLVSNAFVGPGEVVLDAEGTQLPETPLPPGWTVMAQWNAGKEESHTEETVHPDVAAGDITDDTMDVSRVYSKLYARPVVDAEGNQTGVNITDRWGTVKEFVPGVAQDARGFAKVTKTIPCKNVPGWGKVHTEELNSDGSYTPRTFQKVIDTPFWTIVVPPDPQLVNFMPDIDENGGRPAQAAEIHRFGGWPKRPYS